MTEHQTVSPPFVVGVVGAGTMGVGVAQCAAEAGYEVVVVDADPRAVTSGPTRLRDGLRLTRMLRRRPPAASRPPAEERVSWAGRLEELRDARFVIECTRESIPVKESVFRDLDAVCAPDAVLATCTSAIPVSHLASCTKRPGLVIGTHFMNPAPLKDAVEVIRGPETEPGTVRRTRELLAAMGKKGIVVADAPGFVSNRVLMATVNDAAGVVQEGTADAASVDQIFQECFGHAMGPLRTADLIGLDTVVDSLHVLLECTGDARFEPCDLLVGLTAQGHLGRKTGRGFHVYPPGAARR
ncbi:3-hydroxyacyl-CoA dehydrogenase family protein [Streptomyces sp. NBRC 110028]|uniref:3-hydroxyacyl-CoA dehydrogenase family protein n=1 Tax=Streptomyces sp. NBRC 110028 TaxID=1621260 RepID=UPI0006E2F9FA|nr:3-hydroxyacyl-CoA dehydrogenase family protein [Streptomyces sp. NBRC 110028]